MPVNAPNLSPIRLLIIMYHLSWHIANSPTHTHSYIVWRLDWICICFHALPLMNLAMRAQRAFLSKVPATIRALVRLLPSVDQLVLLAKEWLGEGAVAVAAGIATGTVTFVYAAHMQVEIA